MSDSAPVVLDAWPVVEHYKRNDPATSAMDELLSPDNTRRTIMSTVNRSEVYRAVLLAGGRQAANEFADDIGRLVVLESPPDERGDVAALIRSTYHMSLGDSFAVATALDRGAVLWTGDAELLCDGRIWDVEDLRSETIREKHAAAVTRGTKKIGFRSKGTAPAMLIQELRLGIANVRRRHRSPSDTVLGTPD